MSLRNLKPNLQVLNIYDLHGQGPVQATQSLCVAILIICALSSPTQNNAATLTKTTHLLPLTWAAI